MRVDIEQKNAFGNRSIRFLATSLSRDFDY